MGRNDTCYLCGLINPLCHEVWCPMSEEKKDDVEVVEISGKRIELSRKEFVFLRREMNG